jgi:hypothetical protein
MSQQHRKVTKRARRQRYLRRQKVIVRKAKAAAAVPATA